MRYFGRNGVSCEAFFFSSRRRHTRSKRDWSSDVCSSDLRGGLLGGSGGRVVAIDGVTLQIGRGECLGLVGESGCGKTTLSKVLLRAVQPDRSEERRVGKECGCRWGAFFLKSRYMKGEEV